MFRCKIFGFIMLSGIVMGSCSSTPKKTEQSQNIAVNDTMQVVEFNGDSAYRYVKEQVSFGARVPNTDSHKKAGDYLVSQLRRHGANVIEQDMSLKAFDNTILNARNIIGEFNGGKEKRILFLAHWDSRPWADNDPDKSKHKEPVVGANDGASGVGVLLELARIISFNKPDIGVDIVFVDAEDWGDSSGTYESEKTWALGTQYWTENMHRKNYKPLFGVLLDMVGAANAKFYKEYYSMNFAPQITNMVWDIAGKSGYSSYFVNKSGMAVTDDHLFINKAGIPCIDIIDHNGGSSIGFFPGWHTTYDTMDNISAETLKAVGQTITNLVYQYSEQ